MSRKHSPTERKYIFKAYYKGRDVVEVLHYAVVHGKTYTEIKFADGRIHTVPIEELSVEPKEENNAE